MLKSCGLVEKSKTEELINDSFACVIFCCKSSSMC